MLLRITECSISRKVQSNLGCYYEMSEFALRIACGGNMVHSAILLLRRHGDVCQRVHYCHTMAGGKIEIFHSP